jgi:hypothetical protein
VTKLSVDLAIYHHFSYIFRRENRIFVNFFFQIQNMKRGYTGLFWQQNRGYSYFNAFFRISLRKINILKKTKMDLRDLIEFYNRNKKQLLLNLTNILKSATKKKSKKEKKKKKKCQNFFYT